MDVLYRALTSVLLSLMSALGIQPAPATWQMQPLDGRSVSLTISDHSNSSHGATIRIDAFDGLDALLNDHNPSSAQPVHFRLTRDAGRFEFDGVVRRGAGGGTMEFVPSETFPEELARRGFDRPNRIDQMKMAWCDTGFAFIDELAVRKYQHPTLKQLVNAGDHGVDRTYVRDLSSAGYEFGTVGELIRQHDHGINASYIRDLSSFGLRRLSADDLVRLHDHGVSPSWLRAVKAKNSGSLSIDQLVSLHDHGVETLQELRRKTGTS